MANAPTRGYWPELSMDTTYYQRLVEAQPEQADKDAIRAAFRFLRSPKKQESK